MNASLSYREDAVRGASPVRLVILLYQQAIDDLRRAIDCLREGDIEGRTQLINHAIVILGHLEATLDREQGGMVASNLERFYEKVRARLVEAQFKQSPAAIEEQISCLMEVHSAWCEVERQTTSTVSETLPEQPAESLQPGKSQGASWEA